MKTFILTFGLLISVLVCNAQPSTFEKKPRGMAFVPQGSFECRINDTIRNISVDAFWMSNEISNKEYREFTDYAIQHPNDTLFWVDLKKAAGNLNAKQHLEHTTYSQILPTLIDSFALADQYSAGSGEYNKYKNYFTDKAFDSYPVVGVSNKSAVFFCIWKTEKENAELKRKHKPFVMNYRLPVEAEWLYVKDYCKDTAGDSRELQKVDAGKPNKLGLYHLNDNVAEWSASSRNEMKVILGSSSKTGQSGGGLLAANSQKGDLGFRVVRSLPGQRR
jgi:formylglycine-generating enzyme required for sulfatase activity